MRCVPSLAGDSRTAAAPALAHGELVGVGACILVRGDLTRGVQA